MIESWFEDLEKKKLVNNRILKWMDELTADDIKEDNHEMSGKR